MLYPFVFAIRDNVFRDIPVVSAISSSVIRLDSLKLFSAINSRSLYLITREPRAPDTAIMVHSGPGTHFFNVVRYVRTQFAPYTVLMLHLRCTCIGHRHRYHDAMTLSERKAVFTNPSNGAAGHA